MSNAQQKLIDDALAIWQAGLAAVRSDLLVQNALAVSGNTLTIGEESLDLNQVRSLIVVGAGKAGAGMAAGLEAALGPDLMAAKNLIGWINVPEDCVRPLSRIHLHGARPAGKNEPSAAGLAGTQRIRQLVESAAPDDVVIVLLSGGASALLPEPIEGLSLADKLAVTQFLSGAGANINELNTVRKQLSRIKGGGLARACRARQLFTLIISDVPGDPLDVIGSGPTVVDTSTPANALAILDHYQARQAGVAPTVFTQLEARRQAAAPPALSCQVHNVVIGNNATAVEAAAFEAERRGYIHAMTSSPQPEGFAEDVGRHLADMAWHMRNHAGPNCLVSGGEPVVQLAPANERGRGGRNQQLVLAALLQLQELLPTTAQPPLLLLSGGTDGEDGPTDAAGAWCTPQLLTAAEQLNLDLPQHLRRNDAYSAFEQLGTLLKTGPTDTNVCDLRVVLVERT